MSSARSSLRTASLKGDIEPPARIYKDAAETHGPGDTPDSMRGNYSEQQEYEPQEFQREGVGWQIQLARSRSSTQHYEVAPETIRHESHTRVLTTKDDYSEAIRVRRVHRTKRRDEKAFELLLMLDHVRTETPSRTVIIPHANDNSLQGSQPKVKTVLRHNVLDLIFQYCPPGGIFDWNAGHAWLQSRETQLPSTADDRIDLPCPEMAVSFTRLSFADTDESAPMPESLESCLSNRSVFSLPLCGIRDSDVRSRFCLPQEPSPIEPGTVQYLPVDGRCRNGSDIFQIHTRIL